MPRGSSHNIRLNLTVLAIVLAFLAGLTFIASCGPKAQTAPTPISGESLRIIMLDVGQADSILVCSPEGKTMLVDAGDSASDAKERIISVLEQLNINKLDYLVLTHPDQDHVGGMPTILKNVATDKAVFSGQTSTNEAYRDFLALVQEGKATAIKARRGGTLDFGMETTVEILNPPDKLFSDNNNNSVILRLSYGQIHVLLQGDAETEAITSVLDAGINVKADILKVGHHGSTNATNKAWLDAVNPKYALISVGAGNRYGHPHTETLDLLKQSGATIFRTDQTGTITATTDGQSIIVTTAKNAR